MPQKKSLRVLIVDDSADDRELMLRKLHKGGYEPDFLFVEEPGEMEKALDEKKWDLILCDYSMPEFDGLSALNMLKERKLDIPFILISGAIGEEIAVEAMKSGAHDYLMKNNLQRLIPAIERELKEAEIREMHRQAENERDRLLQVVQKSLNEIYIFDPASLRFTYLNQAALNNLGYSEQEISRLTLLDIIPEYDKNYFKKLVEPILQGKYKKSTLSTHFQRDNGSIYPIEINLELIETHSEKFFAAIGFDQTDRIEDAKRIKKQKEIAREHALSNKVKSEFLANMSHELRTPLNSILLLSKLLNKNKEGNLTDEQLRYISSVHNSGNRLLRLVNEVLDLSKIEAEEMELVLEYVELKDICNSLKHTFTPVAKEKDISFEISIDKNIPGLFFTDRLRLEQILSNLLSNAFKFTEQGNIELTIYSPTGKENEKSGVNAGQIVAFRVKDTGIGIPADKHKLIFESFRQVDGSIQRNYGGTGLGLTICNKLSQLLGGSITLESEEKKGSTFTLYLPINSSNSLKNRGEKTEAGLKNKQADKETPDNDFTAGIATEKPLPREQHSPDEKELILIGIHDMEEAELIAGHIRKNNFKPIVIQNGGHVLDYAEKHNPAGIIVDMMLPDLSGWTIAKQLTDSSNAAHIPVWMYTESDELPFENTFNNIKGYVKKPLSGQKIDQFLNQAIKTNHNNSKTLLLIDDSEIHNEALKEFSSQIVDRCLTATSAKQAFEILESEQTHCVVLDMNLPDAGGFDVLKDIKTNEKFGDIPVIIYTGQSLSKKEEDKLLEYAHTVIFKNIGSHKRLLDEVGSVVTRKKQSNTDMNEERLIGKQVLIVDDDPGSFFSISSVLRSNNIQVISAENGREAIKLMNKNNDIDAVLMDIMMPVMNGYKAIMEIRKNAEWKGIPIFAVTAKAMAGDREKCLRAGATDYISKPIDTDKLLSLLNIWL